MKPYNTSRPGHQVMAAATLNVSGGAITLYPDASAGGSVQSSGTKYNASTTAGDSDTVGADRTAVIYTISVVSSAAARYFDLELHDGTKICRFKSGSGGNGQNYTFGPEGMALSGFRVTTDATATELSFLITYDVI